MNKISAFARLDLYTIKPYGKSLLLLLALAVIMTIAFQSLSTLCFYLMMCLVLVMTYPFSIGEANKLDTLYAALALRRRDVVAGRYLFALGMELAVVLLILALAVGISAFSQLEFVRQEIVFSLCLASLLFTVIVAAQYPIYFKLGYNKAKFIAYLPLLLVFLLVMLLPRLPGNVNIGISLDEFLQMLLANPLLAYAALVLIGHLLLALSCLLSCRLYEKRDI